MAKINSKKIHVETFKICVTIFRNGETHAYVTSSDLTEKTSTKDPGSICKQTTQLTSDKLVGLIHSNHIR